MLIAVRHYTEIQPETWQSWPHFTPKEMACRKTGRLMIDPDFMDRLEELRALCGFPLIIGSGYRSPEHNVEVSDTGLDGAHTTGRAADIQVYGDHAFTVIAHAIGLGIRRIGIAQKGPLASRFIHLDIVTDPAFPSPRVWSY